MPNANAKAIAVAYVRPTPELPADAQRAQIEQTYNEHLASKGYALTQWLSDEPSVGAKRLSARPGIGNSFYALNEGDALLMATLSAGFSTLHDMAATARNFGWREVGLYSSDFCGGKFNLADFAALLNVLADFETARSHERATVAVERKRERGRPLNQYGAGFGFKLAGPSRRRYAVPDKQEQATIRWIVDQRRQGFSFEHIYFDMLRRRVKTRTGKEWSLARIKRAHDAAVNFMSESELQKPSPSARIS